RIAMQKKEFRTAMLVSQRDLQMQYLFAVALKAKVARLNHASMNGADRNFMNLFTFHAIERVIARYRFVLIERSPRSR
ncbi:MAG: hypothetical protein AAB658_13230, partial [Chloroflexota bacterium]